MVPDTPQSELRARLSLALQALGLLAAGGLSLGFALGVTITPLGSRPYFGENHLALELRQRLLAIMLGGCVVAVLAGAVLSAGRGNVAGLPRLPWGCS